MSNLQTATKPTLAYIALALGALGVIGAIFIPLAGWILGAAGLVTGFLAFRKPESVTLGQVAMGLGFLAILVGVFFFTSAIA